MAFGDVEGSDRDNRTIFVGMLADKMTEAILYELFFQAGPIERVAIPKDQDGRLKSFGFVTYKHLSSVSYAMNIFAGTKLFGKEIILRNRNGNRSREQGNQQQVTHPLAANVDMSPILLQQQQLIQQQLIMLATGSNMQNYGAQMFGAAQNSADSYASTRSDNAGSHREHYVDRSRYHREENRSNRSKPYRRSRSRSPYQSHRNRERSPVSSNRHKLNDRGNERSNYHRWGKR